MLCMLIGGGMCNFRVSNNYFVKNTVEVKNFTY